MSIAFLLTFQNIVTLTFVKERRAELTSKTWAKIKLLNQNLVRETNTYKGYTGENILETYMYTQIELV